MPEPSSPRDFSAPDPAPELDPLDKFCERVEDIEPTALSQAQKKEATTAICATLNRAVDSSRENLENYLDRLLFAFIKAKVAIEQYQIESEGRIEDTILGVVYRLLNSPFEIETNSTESNALRSVLNSVEEITVFSEETRSSLCNLVPSNSKGVREVLIDHWRMGESGGAVEDSAASTAPLDEDTLLKIVSEGEINQVVAELCKGNLTQRVREGVGARIVSELERFSFPDEAEIEHSFVLAERAVDNAAALFKASNYFDETINDALEALIFRFLQGDYIEGDDRRRIARALDLFGVIEESFESDETEGGAANIVEQSIHRDLEFAHALFRDKCSSNPELLAKIHEKAATEALEAAGLSVEYAASILFRHEVGIHPVWAKIGEEYAKTFQWEKVDWILRHRSPLPDSQEWKDSFDKLANQFLASTSQNPATFHRLPDTSSLTARERALRLITRLDSGEVEISLPQVVDNLRDIDESFSYKVRRISSLLANRLDKLPVQNNMISPESFRVHANILVRDLLAGTDSYTGRKIDSDFKDVTIEDSFTLHSAIPFLAQFVGDAEFARRVIELSDPLAELDLLMIR
ncbi:MAG: hypothetical protein KDD53_01555 [Bdellovibrionales bacterium]|nr:hypothetical protein [Bdellovibrionales bacterium]